MNVDNCDKLANIGTAVCLHHLESNETLEAYSSKQLLYSLFPIPISQTIQVGQTTHAGQCWKK